MRAKPSSPRASRGLIVANLIVYIAIGGLLAFYSEQIGWGWRSFKAYRADEADAEFQLTADQAVLSEAQQALQEGEFEKALLLADRSLAIDWEGEDWPEWQGFLRMRPSEPKS